MSGNGLKSIRGSWGNHFGSISGVIDQFGNFWLAPKPNLGHSRQIFTFHDPTLQPKIDLKFASKRDFFKIGLKEEFFIK